MRRVKNLPKISLVILLSVGMSAFVLAAGNIYDAVSNSNEEVVTVYPNPVLGSEFNIKSDARIVEVTVVNVLGQKVYSQENLDDSNVNINIEHRERGVYLVQIKLESGSVITKRILFK